MLIHAKIRNGQVELREPIPADWEGQTVQITTLTPDEPAIELEQRLRELHELGPMEYEPGERENIAALLAKMDSVSEASMRRLAGTES